MRRTVNLTKRVKADGKWSPFLAVVWNKKNGSVKPDAVMIGGKETEITGGTFYIDWYDDDGNRKREAVGESATEATDAKRVKESILNNVQKVDSAPIAATGGKTLREAMDVFLEDTRLARSKKTLAVYSRALGDFAESTKKNALLSDLTKRDLLKFSDYVRTTKKLSPRTTYNKFEAVITFLKASGVSSASLKITKADWPRFTEETPEIYKPEELAKFFAACEPTDKLVFEFFLKTGMREQEVMHATWENIDLARKVVHVRANDAFGWNPKTFVARNVPIPESLVTALRAWKGDRDRGCELVFPTSGCRPKNDFLDICKATAKRAGMDGKFWLHKFRATFCTTALRKGVDLRTAMAWMGHKDIESTMRYLRPNENEAVRDAVNGMWD